VMSVVKVANSNAAVAPSAARVPLAGTSIAPNATQTPLLLSFRAFGLGEDAPAADDMDVPMPRNQAPLPNREAPPPVLPPAPPGDAAAFVEPVTVPPNAPAPMTPETPSERRELRAGDVGKTLLAMFGVAGIAAFGGEMSSGKRAYDPEENRKPRA
jgi:hypothetical protein